MKHMYYRDKPSIETTTVSKTRQQLLTQLTKAYEKILGIDGMPEPFLCVAADRLFDGTPEHTPSGHAKFLFTSIPKTNDVAYSNVLWACANILLCGKNHSLRSTRDALRTFGFNLKAYASHLNQQHQTT